MPKKQLVISVLLVFSLLSSGCVALFAGAAAGGAGVIWQKGKLAETMPVTVAQMHRAIKAGLTDLKIHITEDRADSLTAKVRGRMADDTKIWVDAESTGSSTTELIIRVGYMGDKSRSLRIRDAIRKHL